MEFAYLDESGDLGENGSKTLTLVLICTSKKEELSRIIRRTKQRLLQTKKGARWLNRNGGEIKFRYFPEDYLLKKLLKEIAGVPLAAYVMNFEKMGKKIARTEKSFIMDKLFREVYEKNAEKMPHRITADSDFFH